MDKRTKRQKLESMANQSVSPNEAEIARRKLDELPPDPPHIMTNGTTFSVRFEFTMSDPDPGVGIYDYVKGEWTWYPSSKGSGEGW